MVRRTSDLIGRPVVSSDSGKKLGTITDVLVDESEGRLVGLVLQHGWLKSEEVLPATAVQTLGTDAVVSRSSELMDANQWRERHATSSSSDEPSADQLPWNG